MLEVRRTRDVPEPDALSRWFEGRFWPELLRIHKQARSIVQLIAEQRPAPVRLPDSLIDPQPLLHELARLPGANQHPVALHVESYLLAWQSIRHVAITRQPIRNGGALFDVMTNSAGFFADVGLASARCRMAWVQ